MELLSSTSASGVETNVTIASKSRVPHWLVVQCEPGSSPSCDAKRVDAVSVRGRHHVFIRYEEPDNASSGKEDKEVARVRVVKGDVHDQEDVLVRVSMTNELLTLDVTASRKTVEVVLLQKDQLQRVVNRGSGDVVVEDNVLATTGPSLSIAALGSGDTFATSSGTVKVDTLTLSSTGSGLLQTSFSEIRVSKLVAEYYASGDTALFVDSGGDADSVALIAEGSGDACLSWGSSMAVNQFEVEQVGSGDVSVGPRGSCQSAKLSMRGSGGLDVGGVQCDSVVVDLMSSGKVTVHATDSLAVEAYGSGHVKFTGAAPHAIASTGASHVNPTPVKDSYLPTKCKRHKVPAIKSKYAALSTGVLASAELDSAESSPPIAVHPGMVWHGMNRDQDNLVPLAAVVFLVAMVLRWFNNSRRRAREEQREPLLGAQRRVYV
ncbi:hypothetical protein PHYPSEUDO_004978 [Phytophthora pseudosyringae]|uniref:Putative auto-transporter adhesin head GIN domain-containing protein n=1 Tax=Phytophthora pseudosyringae TaxID=221518 RepID=A0A8T1WHK2_9STRA|nr:hypothetical protein PHYPSEUDO_004978 [Phytophthora pseudosyringae]